MKTVAQLPRRLSAIFDGWYWWYWLVVLVLFILCSLLPLRTDAVESIYLKLTLKFFKEFKKSFLHCLPNTYTVHTTCCANSFKSWGRILGRKWDKSLKSFPEDSTLLTYFTPPLPMSKSGLKLVCNVNILLRNLKPENSQDYAQKHQRNCTFMNLASGNPMYAKVLHINFRCL
jgi:hypothetical protein